MPELPEVEVLVRHLAPLLKNQTIRAVQVRRAKVIAPDTPRRFRRVLIGARFDRVIRRGKYLVFTLRPRRGKTVFPLIGHLGMTGRMYLLPQGQPRPKHAAVVFALDRQDFVYEDFRYFGRLALEASALTRLGPEPLDGQFTVRDFAARLDRSRQAIKVKLLDQSLVAGIGNIYASEALFAAQISPILPACRLTLGQVGRLRRAIRHVLRQAIRFGSTVPLNWAGAGLSNELFYYGEGPESMGYYEEKLRVYDRAGQPCFRCGAKIRRVVQAARSTYFCPTCQTRNRPK